MPAGRSAARVASGGSHTADRQKAASALPFRLTRVHNRAGEAEKSHQKAKNQGFRDFWTVIVKKGLDMSKLKSESPTTTLWFDAAQVLGRNGEEWNAFRSRLIGEVGIPL